MVLISTYHKLKSPEYLMFSLAFFFLSKSVLEDSNLLWQPALFIRAGKNQAFVSMHSGQCTAYWGWEVLCKINDLVQVYAFLNRNCKMQEEIVLFLLNACIFISFSALNAGLYLGKQEMLVATEQMHINSNNLTIIITSCWTLFRCTFCESKQPMLFYNNNLSELITKEDVLPQRWCAQGLC